MASQPGVGVWIDHKQARLIRFREEEPVVTTMLSEVESLRRSTGHRGVSLPGHLGGDDENKRRHRWRMELNRYYDRVAGQLAGEDAIFLLGPGAATRELCRRLEEQHAPIAERIVGAATVGRLTEAQIIARVREFFAKAASAA